ncbi:chemotaxis protein CheX [Natroniella sulfidigena]|uniref:chemotaxis protein CheX n=1 Tax=Natroniella sulfidigena TaxID=723921 RepID=UPI00200A4847|nr:chemotaxis protein CheX [Natroniella sulfidigena]MCK8818033.1 chemotaxis protein CheX [Natroniella sulfidigena]
MTTDYIEPIFTATNKVLNNILQLEEIEQGPTTVTEELISAKKVNISIGVTGELEGAIIFSFSEEMALKIVQEMSGMEITGIDKFVTSAVGELGNIICGNAMTELNQNDYCCDITPPQVIIGVDNKISLSSEEISIMPLETDFGAFEVNIGLCNC